MAAHKPLHLFEAKAADTRISKDDPAVARLGLTLPLFDSFMIEYNLLHKANAALVDEIVAAGRTAIIGSPIAQALLSVSDKTGLIDFAGGLSELGVALLSTGGALGDRTSYVLDMGAASALAAGA